MSVSSAITANTWIDDPFNLPNVSNGRNIYTAYDANSGNFIYIMKRTSGQKISVSQNISQGADLYISGFGG